MKTMKKGIWVWGLCCLAVVACKEEQHPQLPRTAGGELVYMVVDSLLTEQERELKAEYIHLVPDYLLTEEEEEVKQARLKKWKEEVEDKHFQFDSTTKLQAFDMTLEEFLQTGFQEAEYWAFKAKIARNNQWVKDTMPKLQAKWKAFAQSMKLVEIDSTSEDWHPESYYTNEGKIIPAWVREEVSAEEYRIIEQLNERYDLHFTLWEGLLEELAVRMPKEKTQATVDFLLNAEVLTDFLEEVQPAIVEQSGEEPADYVQTNTLWRAKAGNADVHLDMALAYAYDKERKEATLLNANGAKISLDAEDLSLRWDGSPYPFAQNLEGKAFRIHVTGTIIGELDLGKCLRVTVTLKDYSEDVIVRILPEAGAEDAAVVWGRQSTMYHL